MVSTPAPNTRPRLAQADLAPPAREPGSACGRRWRVRPRRVRDMSTPVSTRARHGAFGIQPSRGLARRGLPDGRVGALLAAAAAGGRIPGWRVLAGYMSRRLRRGWWWSGLSHGRPGRRPSCRRMIFLLAAVRLWWPPGRRSRTGFWRVYPAQYWSASGIMDADTAVGVRMGGNGRVASTEMSAARTTPAGVRGVSRYPRRRCESRTWAAGRRGAADDLVCDIDYPERPRACPGRGPVPVGVRTLPKPGARTVAAPGGRLHWVGGVIPPFRRNGGRSERSPAARLHATQAYP